MVAFIPIKNTKANILNTPIVEGQFLTATDTGEIWLDVGGGVRLSVGGVSYSTMQTYCYGDVVTDLSATSKTLNPPVERTWYHFGTLTNLTLQNIPVSDSWIVIFFSSGSTATSLVLPSGTKVLDGSSLPISANASYEMSILNGDVSISKRV